ncbi:C13 family peptidase [Methanoregula sp. UBA64]|uniref:C13 family peptidase n=1 Tax=Methanoregula sp. UBA64 TaxID=1915554 RepID=UPI0025DD310E|nr:C13 family peptidase [Methanoregula sp. UBA64]
MIIIDKKKFALILALILLAIGAAYTGYFWVHAHTPVRIGVLLPITGDVDLKDPLEWAKDNINARGGIGGRQVELVYRDTGSGNTTQLARELLADDSIHMVIGPPTSDDVYTLAPEFANKKKLLISPLATSGDIIRAFGKTGYFWRTVQGDVAQDEALVTILHAKGVKHAALLTENTTYGSTFYDWTGFFATESGIDLTSIQEFEPGSATLDAEVNAALATRPEYIIAACGPEDAATIKKAIDRSGSSTKLILTDAAATPVLVSTLGSSAEGLEGTSPTADPTSGFATAYTEKFGTAPTDYAAPAYDAVLLAAYTAARQEAAPFESPPDSFRYVVDGNDTVEDWTPQQSHDAIDGLVKGQSPYVTGASQPFIYDTEYGVDPVITYYSHWVIRNGTYVSLGTLGSEKSGASKLIAESGGLSQASQGFMTLNTPAGAPDTGNGNYVPRVNRTGFEAVIVGPSPGWTNYRHESDALAMYTLLKDNGVPDDHIILMLYDDVPTSPQNPVRGDVHNMVGGANLRSEARVDYRGANVTAATLAAVLTGNRSAQTPVVLESNASTDVFVYIASHGSPGSILFPTPDTSLSAGEFATLTDTMAREGRYRQMVFFVDTCFGESVATNATAKGLLYFTGANRNEPSLGAVYDPNIRQWLSDEFTQNVLIAVRNNPHITFRDLYTTTYEQVTGSHVQMLNTRNFGDIDTEVMKFLSP